MITSAAEQAATVKPFIVSLAFQTQKLLGTKQTLKIAFLYRKF